MKRPRSTGSESTDARARRLGEVFATQLTTDGDRALAAKAYECGYAQCDRDCFEDDGYALGLKDGRELERAAVISHGREWIVEMANSSVFAVNLDSLDDWFNAVEEGAHLRDVDVEPKP